jgi:hypothetical protein
MTNKNLQSDDFDSNISFENDTSSLLLNAENETNTNSVSSRRTTKQSSSIHKHTRIATAEEKTRTKKSYFCRYCASEDSKEHHSSIREL